MLEIKVVIADDHPIVLFGVREIIMRDSRFKLVAEATNSSQLIAQLEEYQPDVVITDFNMPGDASLTKRPMNRVANPLREMGAVIETAAEGRPPMTIRDRKSVV